MSASALPVQWEPVPCLCCGTYRPPALIGRFTTDLSAEYGASDGTVVQTVTYCKDRSDCRGRAQTLRIDRGEAVLPIAGRG